VTAHRAPALSVRRQPAPQAVLLVAAFGAFLAFLDSTIVNVAFPDIQASFPDASIGSLSWVLNGYNIVFAAFLVAAGRLADLLGRRRMFVSGVVLFTVASVACAAADSVGQLIVFRLVQGVGAAVLVPASLALVVEAFPAARRAHGVGLWGAAAAVASGLGPPIGGALVEASSWRLAFLVNLPLGVAAVLVARHALVESRATGRRRVPDLRGAVLLAAALGLVTLGLVQGEERGWLSLPVLGALLAAAAALAGFVRSSRRHPAPVLDPALLRIRSFAVGTATTVVAGIGFYAYLLTHILFLAYVWRYSLLERGSRWRRERSSRPSWPRVSAPSPTPAATGWSSCPAR
jgi:NTE family protein